jgi:chromosomal replication initiation ATPase DnaA
MTLARDKAQIINEILLKAEWEISRIVGEDIKLNMSNKLINPEDLRLLICGCLNITVQKFRSRCKKRELSDARMIYYLLAKKIFENITDDAIAELTNRDRSAVNRAVRVANGLVRNNYLFRAKMNSVVGKINIEYPFIHLK